MARGSPFLKWQIDKAVEMRESGHTYHHIAIAIGCSASAILLRLKAMGISPKVPVMMKKKTITGLTKGFRLTPEQVQEAFELRGKGMSYEKIANKIGSNANTVFRFLEREDIDHACAVDVPVWAIKAGLKRDYIDRFKETKCEFEAARHCRKLLREMEAGL